jgi:hypothetical protein
MRRRHFITLLGTAAATWPLAARAQLPSKLPTIGFFSPNTASAQTEWTDAFVQRLRELVCGDPLVTTNRVRIATLALRARLPTVYNLGEHVDAGGLMSYGADLTDLHRRAAELVDKVLRGAKPTDIPVQQPIKFDLAINLKTAKALGLAVPPTLIAIADEVIE